ncbi:surface protease GP63 [Trypanosoma rangeli]|uniref:Leishmanolysin-like peptidase n=1 Tax=Trypanosoma rangeli TaxID=5698 RepID=A0A422MNP7_TRYRA|nr:surface protease GP63 [Trypanosoma rangeli]RNE94834.1 surface protease GP63 [Trypanosoma rangeli]|eukprot:RNE94834.1 surface protease GP63 [Trypanosoma rangeli]
MVSRRGVAQGERGDVWPGAQGGCAVAAVCAEVACARGSFRVRYIGDSDWYDCPEGSSLSGVGTSVNFASGKIRCPKYDEVCTITPAGRSGVTRHPSDDDELWALGTITPHMHCTVSPDVGKDFVNAGAPSCSAPKELSRRRSGKEKDQRGWREKSER